MLAHSASMRSAGSGGPSMPGIASGRIEGIAGMQFETPRPERSSASRFASSSWESLNSQMPMPSRPAAAYANTSSANDALTVEISLSDSFTAATSLAAFRWWRARDRATRRCSGAFVSSLATR